MKSPRFFLLLSLASGLSCSVAAGAPCAASRATTQEASQKKPAQSDDAGNSLDPEFDAVWKQYVSAKRDRDEIRIKAVSAKGTEIPPDPILKYFPRFMQLAEKDSADAQCWVLENLSTAVPDKQEQARIYRQVFALLIPKHADMDGVYRAIGGIRRGADALGEAETAAMLQKIVDVSTNAEVRAQALFGVAWLKVGRGQVKDPQRMAEAREIYHQITIAFPGTKTAKEASGYLMPVVEQSFLDAERKWVSQVAKLVAEKKPITDWPKQPIHEFERDFQPLAEAGHLQAKQWVRMLYPDYVAVEKQGPEIALTWLVDNLRGRYTGDIEGWGQVRMDMLRLLYTQFPSSTAPWVTASLEGLARESKWMPYAMVEPTLKPLLEGNRDSKVRGLALLASVKSQMRTDDPETNRRVKEILQEIVDKHSEEDVASDAHELLDGLVNTLPGSPAPDFFVFDSAHLPIKLSEYHGRVVMLVFSSFAEEACNRTIPQRLALMKKLDGRPFSVLGIDVDSPAAQNYQEQAAKYGVTWRTVLVYTPKDELVQNYMVRTYPTALVIDADGVIRSRNAPWDETEKLVEKLVAEAEAKSPKKAAASDPKH